MNQYYSEELSQKTRRGQRETRLKGLHSAGKLNYGYYTKNKKVYIHEEEGPVVKEIFERYAAGERGNEIAICFAGRSLRCHLDLDTRFSISLNHYQCVNYSLRHDIYESYLHG